MKSIISTIALVAATICYVASPVIAQQPTISPAAGLSLRTPVYVGCFSDPGNLNDMGDYTYQTGGWCQPLCVRQSNTIYGLVNGTNCLCGNEVPSKEYQVDNSECDTPCAGYGQDNCGGTNRYMIYSDEFKQGDPTGTIQITVPPQTYTEVAKAAASQTSDTESVATSHVNLQSTVFITRAGSAVASVITTIETTAPESGSGPNKAIIAAGVVVAIVAIAGVVGCIIFFLRHRKQKALEAERRRHEAMTSFVTGEKAPSTFSLNDARLEPSVMFQRRQSDGSIMMDNQDYSRRILKVTNPDDR